MYRNPCWWATQSERWQPGGGFWLRRWTVISSLIQTSQRELTLINKEKRGQWYTLLFLNYGPTNICSLHPPPTPKTFFFPHFPLFHATNRTRPLSLTLLHIPAFLRILLDDPQWGNCDFFPHSSPIGVLPQHHLYGRTLPLEHIFPALTSRTRRNNTSQWTGNWSFFVLRYKLKKYKIIIKHCWYVAYLFIGRTGLIPGIVQKTGQNFL